ncbi:blue-sensitive opsin-like isoform X2 [Phyllopteryx taeniolatus]|uniref:blue-sensitive opsin-like isoform X2 n=1 Tax=Phyllopteryx taeniolatus TaxID=161469 RepID=UPI002AD4D771|nr:blue-sensitive opsin-like isoform X2 [Phyllopteryx taeniolatus]
MRRNHPLELPSDFWIPIPLDTNNITLFSPFLVPQDHLGSKAIFYSMSAFMLFIFVTGTAINIATIACTVKYKKLRSHLNYILVNLAVANLLVSCVGSFTCFYCFAFRYMILGALACKIEGFTATLGVPFFTIVFCYSQLLIVLKSAAKAQAESASTQKAEREVTRMVVVMVLGFLVCWMPYASFALWVVNNRGQPFDLRLATIPSCFSKASTVYNPFIYIFLNKQFRSCMKMMLGMSGDDDDEASKSQSTTEVSKVGPA